MNVCRLNPPLSSTAGTPGAWNSSPIVRPARSGFARAEHGGRPPAAPRAGPARRGTGPRPGRGPAPSRGRPGAPCSRRRRPRRPLDLGRLGGDLGDLAQPGAVVALEHDVAAALQGEPVQRRLELEGHPVHGRRQRQGVAFDVLAGGPVAGHPLGQPVGRVSMGSCARRRALTSPVRVSAGFGMRDRTDSPRSRTSGRHAGASRARAATNFGPGAAIQSPGHMSVVGT